MRQNKREYKVVIALIACSLAGCSGKPMNPSVISSSFEGVNVSAQFFGDSVRVQITNEDRKVLVFSRSASDLFCYRIKDGVKTKMSTSSVEESRQLGVGDLVILYNTESFSTSIDISNSVHSNLQSGSKVYVEISALQPIMIQDSIKWYWPEIEKYALREPLVIEIQLP